MNNPKFYIYGVPDGFNMLSGTSDEILYYQLFYDTTKRGREMRINRKANGETVYSYLVYNLVSCKGREGAFLGMSIAFTGNEYCNNPVSLKELFDGIYNEVILKADANDKIISAIDGGNAVGRFCISKFDERQDMCEKIGRIVINNVVGELASSISTIDTSFDNSKEGRILTLPIDADKASINQALRSYSWVSLSSECKASPVTTPKDGSTKTFGHKSASPIINSQDLLSAHYINELTNKVSGYKDFIIQGLKGLVSTDDIAAKIEEINFSLDTIEGYAGRQPELSKLKDDYLSIYNELTNLKPKQEDVLTPFKPGAGPHPNPNKGKNKIWQITRNNLLTVVACFCIVLVAAAVMLLWPSDEYGKHDDFNRQDFELLLAKAKYRKAWEMLQKIEDQTEREKFESAWQKSYTTAFESMLDDAKYKEAWEMLREVEGKTEREKFESAWQESYNTAFKSMLDDAKYKEAWEMLQKVESETEREKLKSVWQKSYNNWFTNEFEKRKNDRYMLSDLTRIISTCKDFNTNYSYNIQLINEEINNLDKMAKNGQQKKLEHKQSNDNTKKDNAEQKTVIRIFHADTNYNKKEAISPRNNTISCIRNSRFVVEGAKYTSKDGDIEVVPHNDGSIRIRAKSVGAPKIKLNQVEYTFKVTN